MINTNFPKRPFEILSPFQHQIEKSDTMTANYVLLAICIATCDWSSAVISQYSVKFMIGRVSPRPWSSKSTPMFDRQNGQQPRALGMLVDLQPARESYSNQPSWKGRFM